MLSATPVNNRFNDLQEPAPARLRRRVGATSPRSSNISTSDREGLPRGPAASSTSGRSCPPRSAPPTRSCAMLDFDFFELLDAVTIARSRKHIQAFYDTTDIGAFPERLPAGLDPRAAHRPARRRRRSTRSSSSSRSLDARRLHPAGLRLPEPAAEVRGPLRTSSGGTARSATSGSRPRAGPEEAHDGQPAQALESSVEAFRLTLGKIEGAVDQTLGRPRRRTTARSPTSTSAFADLDADDDDFDVRRRGAVGRQEDQDRPRRHGHRVLAARPLATTARPSASCSTRWTRSRPSTTASSSASSSSSGQGRATRSTPATARC